MKLLIVSLFWLSWPTAFCIWQWVKRDRQYSKWYWDGYRDQWRGYRNPANGSGAYFFGQQDAKRTASAMKFLGLMLLTVALAIIVPLSLIWSLK